MNQVKVKVVHIVSLYKRQSDNEQVFQLKLKTMGTSDELGEVSGVHYYYKVTKPKVAVTQEVTIDLDRYNIVAEEFTPKDNDKAITLKYLIPKDITV